MNEAINPDLAYRIAVFVDLTNAKIARLEARVAHLEGYHPRDDGITGSLVEVEDGPDNLDKIA